MFLCVFKHTQGHTDVFACKYLITCSEVEDYQATKHRRGIKALISVSDTC